MLAETVYGKQPSELNEEEKQNLLNASKALAGVASGVVSGGNGAETLANASVGMVVAENAVENNFLKQAMENSNQIVQLGLLEEGEKVKKEIEKKAAEAAVEEVVDVADKYAPHYAVVNLGVYGIDSKVAVNLRNFDVFYGGSFSPVVLPNRFGASAGASLGWFTNLENSDLKNSEKMRITGDSISRNLQGPGIGASGCYKLVCAGYGQTISVNPADKSYKNIELGVGVGGSGGSIDQGYLKGINNEDK
ncbi:VENN motif pre-toxin domain-containing protein [Bibersteinia trehalosi]|uniref:VENN motif pre-toxin domain-containing protein n=1 Tax=Bibersteinia trehalosi TaxID=47735 RepID=UPI00130EB819|nr:VENN motif pre-toxin domain-containing protein [Bibersteinia trehalosi]